MPIVDHGQSRPLLTKRAARPKAGWTSKKYRIGHTGPQFQVFGDGILKAEDAIATICAHFQCKRTDAFKLALHLTAKAIRAGRLSL